MSGRITQLKYSATGKCERCGRRRPASATLCRSCLSHHNQTTAAIKAALVQAGKCAWCARANRSAYRTCDDCRARHNEARRLTRQR